jgi:hypothetical protein
VRAPSAIPDADSTKTVFDDARQRAVLAREPGLLAEPGHGAHGVEEVGQHQREHQQAGRQDADAGEGAEQIDVAHE